MKKPAKCCAVPALHDLGERLSSASVEWIRLNEDLAHSASQTVVDSITTARWRILAANVAAILLTALLGFLTFLRIVKPIQALDASVRAIAAGDYGKEVPFTRATDETGGLARSVDVLKQGAAAMDEQRWVKANVSRAHRRAAGRRLAGGVRPAPRCRTSCRCSAAASPDFYVLDDEPRRAAARRDATAWRMSSDIPTVIRLGEGLVGQCAQERQTARADESPA